MKTAKEINFLLTMLIVEACLVCAKPRHSQRTHSQSKLMKFRSGGNRGKIGIRQLAGSAKLSKGGPSRKNRRRAHRKTKTRKLKSRKERMAMLYHILGHEPEKQSRSLGPPGGSVKAGPVSVTFCPPPVPNKAPITIKIPKLKISQEIADPNNQKPIILANQLAYAPHDHRRRAHHNKRHSTGSKNFNGLANPYYMGIPQSYSSNYQYTPEFSSARQEFAYNPGISEGMQMLADGVAASQSALWTKRGLI
jgi:hypothetical protein